MRILLTCGSFLEVYGGPAFSVSGLARALAEQGADVGIWAPDGSALTSGLLSDADPSFARLNGNLRQVMLRFGIPDLIHDNGIWMPHNHRIASFSRAKRIPRIVSTRGMLEPWARRYRRFKKDLAWRLYQRRDLISASFLHATAAAEADHLESLALGIPIVTIPNGVDLPELAQLGEPNDRPSGDGKRVALFLSRIHPKKGLPLLIDAWKRLMPEGWVLHIAGPDEEGHLAEVKARVRTTGLGDRVRFLGAIPGGRRAAIYRSADLFVLPTHSENFGLVIAEALAHGLPVVTTTGAPWPELESWRCGWRVPPTAEGVVEGLKAATSCPPDVLRDMGLKGRKMVGERFSWRSVASQFLPVYAQAVETPASLS